MILTKYFKKIIIKNIILGIKQAWNIPSLPLNIGNFYSHIFTRIFRFIGGLTVLITITKGYDHIQLHNYFNELLCNIIIFSTYLFASIFIVFTIIINLIRISYTIYIIFKKPEVFEVRNSPLNLFATQVAKILSCIKIGCIATGSTAAVIAGGVSFDTLIEKSGRSPIFVPMMAEGLNLILGKPTSLVDVVKILPDISSDTDKVPGTGFIEDSTTDTDFNTESVSEALESYHNLSLTEKHAFWEKVQKDHK